MNTKEKIGSAPIEADRLDQLLFHRDGHRLRNIKFFRGHRDVVSADEMTDTIHRAILARRSGHVQGTTEFPDVKRIPVEVSDLVKNL